MILEDRLRWVTMTMCVCFGVPLIVIVEVAQSEKPGCAGADVSGCRLPPNGKLSVLIYEHYERSRQM